MLSKLNLLGVSEAENIKITVKDIKDYLNNDSLFVVINKFKSLRDDISHGFISNDKFLYYLDDFLCTSDFLLLIDSLNLDADLTKLIKTVLKRLKICFTKEYKNNCLKDCKEMLRVNKDDGGSNYTVLEVVSHLKSKYDLCVIQNSIISIIGNEYVI